MILYSPQKKDINNTQPQSIIKTLPYHLEGLYGKRKYSEKEIQACKDAGLNVQSKKQKQDQHLEKRKINYKNKVDTYVDFVKQHKQKPRRNSQNTLENRLYHFYNDNMKKYRNTLKGLKKNCLNDWQIKLFEPHPLLKD